MRTAVAIALYNGMRFLEKQLDTIRMQTRQPDCVILCDDGSSDNTVEFVQDYIQKNNLSKTWKLYQNGENLGYIRNFYRAISLCDADWVFLSDQDDLWKLDKIEKMCEIAEQNEQIKLLSCKYAIIDGEDKQQHSIVERDAEEDGSVRSIDVNTILRAYRWPGMLMCVRKEFFDRILPAIEKCRVAHDLMLAICAADENGFYEYSYIGAFHRRHENNTAREEHRISKLLNMERKLFDIAEVIQLWSNLLSRDLPISEKSRRQISERLELMLAREDALKNKSLKKIIAIYGKDKGHYLRTASFLCDIWLVCFG